MGMFLDVDDCCAGHPEAQAELRVLRDLAAQRGEQLKMLRDEMREIDWLHFCDDHPEAKQWFDADGDPVVGDANL
jgi:hypothetical protein